MRMTTGLNKVIEVLAKARKRGVQVALQGDQLSVRAENGGKIDPAVIEEVKSIRDEIVAFLRNEAFGASTARPEPLVSGTRAAGDRVPLSHAQKRLWIIDKVGGSVQYHLPLALRLTGDVDAALVGFIFGQIVARHEALRTVVREADGTAFQQVRPAGDWALEYHEAAGSGNLPDEYLQEYLRRPFDLSKDYLLRAGLHKVGPQECILLVVVHHIASDGLSMQIMVKEFVELYWSRKENRPAHLPPLAVQYADYALWQQRHLDERLVNGQLAYWEEQLRGAAPLELPLDYPRPAVQPTKGNVLHAAPDAALAGQLRLLAQQEGVTPYVALLAAFNVLLYRYTGQEDVCIGTPATNRTQRATENLIGFFVNTLVLRNHVDGGVTFRELLQRVKQTTLRAFAHQDVPFEQIVERLVTKRDLSRSPLFQVMFAVQQAPSLESIDLGEVHLSLLEAETQTAKFDLSFEITATEAGLGLRVEYCSDLFSDDTMRRMMAHYRNLLREVVADPGKPAAALAMLNPAEQRQLLALGHTASPYPADQTIPGLFAAAAARTPDAVALIFGDQRVSYRQLDERSNQLAHFLLQHGAVPGGRVPLMMEKCPEMIIAMLAVLKAGCAYVPVDLTYPAHRVAYLLENTAARLVVVQHLPEETVAQLEGIRVVDAAAEAARVDACPKTPVDVAPGPASAAYVIYTSGSTGQPKGVVVEHRSVLNLLCYQAGVYQIGPHDKILLFFSYSFDPSVEQIWLALFNGAASVILRDEQRLEPRALEALLHREGITHLHVTPGYLEQLTPGPYNGLKRVVVGGDACKRNLAEKWKDYAAFYNEYGPTETTITSLAYRYDGSPADGTGNLPIGRPVGNTRVYVLDKSRNLLPRGATGEIYIAGDGLAREYLSNDRLTKASFVADPFHEGARMYKTGDLGKWLPDGTMAFLGRGDNQVKVRGYRVEPGEVETRLLAHPDVEAAVVVAKGDGQGGHELAAYLTGKTPLRAADVRAYLGEHLPSFMLPAYYVQLDAMPLTANGKIDLRALPAPQEASLPAGDQYVAPRNALEAQLVQVWQEVLGNPNVGVYDNFFDVGGNSVKLIRMVSLVNERLGIPIAAVTAFKLPNIHALAGHLGAEPAEPVAETAEDLRESVGIMEHTIGLLMLNRSADEE